MTVSHASIHWSIKTEKRTKGLVYIRPVETKDRVRSWFKQRLFPEPASSNHDLKIDELLESIKDTYLASTIDHNNVLSGTKEGDHLFLLTDEGEYLYVRASLGLIGRGLRDYGWHLVRAVEEIRYSLPKDYCWRRSSLATGRFLWLYVIVPAIEDKGEHWSYEAEQGHYFQVISTAFDRNPKVIPESHPRHYRSTSLPTLRPSRHSEDDSAREDLLLKLYDQICSQYRALADTRFKLLGLLPAASVLAWTQLFGEGVLNQPLAGLAIAWLGLFVTVGIRIYDKRNDALYNDLISRGRKIEEELGVHTGMFRGRRKPRNLINHGNGTRLIYTCVFLGWLTLGIWFAILTAGCLPASVVPAAGPTPTIF